MWRLRARNASSKIITNMNYMGTWRTQNWVLGRGYSSLNRPPSDNNSSSSKKSSLNNERTYGYGNQNRGPNNGPPNNGSSSSYKIFAGVGSGLFASLAWYNYKAAVATELSGCEHVTKALEAAQLANDAYDRSMLLHPPNYSRITSSDELSKLDISQEMLQRAGAFIYKSGIGKYTIAYAGTKTASDWGVNLTQGTGIPTARYDMAMKIAQRVATTVGKENLTLVGHSLGGGCATAAAVLTNCYAVVFNPAGIHLNTIKQGEEFVEMPRKGLNNVVIYTTNKDILNAAQNNRTSVKCAVMSLSFLSMGFMGWTIGFIALAFGGEIVFNMTFEDWFPQAHGNEPHVIETDANWGLDGHGIQAFIEVLQAQKDSLCAQKIQLEADLPRE